ncbi:protein of unknown function DUF4408 [Dillenia turbinata]|uniref:DUF4408 domain-containing protein n=1 Tax=Dillenia turbinata TaxID=194707 RepID=A0AAN8ZBW8_9MAGN
MALMQRSSSSSSWLLTLKVVLISSGVAFLALLLKLSIPAILDFAVYSVPIIWTSFLSWLKPPYLYVIINGIIITIAASSRFHRKSPAHDDDFSPEIPSPAKILSDPAPGFSYETVTVKSSSEQILTDSAITESPEVTFGYDDTILAKNQLEIPTEFVYKEAVGATDSDMPAYDAVLEKNQVQIPSDLDEEIVKSVDKVVLVVEEDEADEFVISRSTWTPPARMDSTESLSDIAFLPAEKPLVSSRFGHHRRAPKSTPEGGKALRVSKPKRHETLENTWKTITEGRAMPLTRHLRKCDTWETHNHSIISSPQDLSPSPDHMKKSATLKDRTNYPPPPPPSPPLSSSSHQNASPGSGTRLRKEPSLSQDELNRRVEAFIKKFNEEMRLQRQESLNQYWEMIGRGANQN